MATGTCCFAEYRAVWCDYRNYCGSCSGTSSTSGTAIIIFFCAFVAIPSLPAWTIYCLLWTNRGVVSAGSVLYRYVYTYRCGKNHCYFLSLLTELPCMVEVRDVLPLSTFRRTELVCTAGCCRLHYSLSAGRLLLYSVAFLFFCCLANGTSTGRCVRLGKTLPMACATPAAEEERISLTLPHPSSPVLRPYRYLHTFLAAIPLH